MELSSLSLTAALSPTSSVDPFITLYGNASARTTIFVDPSTYPIPYVITVVPTISTLGTQQLSTSKVPLRYQNGPNDPTFWSSLKNTVNENPLSISRSIDNQLAQIVNIMWGLFDPTVPLYDTHPDWMVFHIKIQPSPN